MCRRLTCAGLAASLSIPLLSTIVLAQKTTGDVTGSVTDTTDGLLPGVTVTAVCTATNLTRSAVTDSQGGYGLPELPVCDYTVTAVLPGFKPVSRAVQVAVSTVAKVDFRMEIGAQEDTIRVEGVRPLVEFSDKLNNYVDTDRIEEIPLSGRDFNSLLGVTPGLVRNPGGGVWSVSVSGSRHTSNNFMIDGISNNDRFYGDSVLNRAGAAGVPASLVPVDAIAEFTVQQTPSAEFGVKGGGAINVVMKSGTNQLHGSAYDFRHDDWTDAANFFVARSGGGTTPAKNQQYGGTLGGPIVKDKTFYFGYYEGQRLAVTSPYTVQVPTAAKISAARARIAAAGLTTNPIGETLLQYYPTDPSGRLTVDSANTSSMNTFGVKIDHQLTHNNLVNGRFFWGSSFQSAPASRNELTPANGPHDFFNTVTNPTRVALLGAVWNSTLSSHALLETRLGYNRISQTLDVNNKIDPASLGINTGPLDPADFGVPVVNLGNFGAIGGFGTNLQSTTPTETWDVSTALTETRGRHTIKMGGNWQLGKSHSIANNGRSTFMVTGGTLDDIDSLVGLLLGRFNSASRSFGSTDRNLSQHSFGAFINDQWNVTSRVMISGGLRYDLHLPLTEANDQAANFLPERGLVRVGQGLNQLYRPDKNDFGPRAGVAWDINGDGRTSVRTGYSLTYDLPEFWTLRSPIPGLTGGAGAFTQPDLGVFSVTLKGSTSHKPDDALATCLNPNTGGGDYVCVQPGVPIYGSSPTGAPPFNAVAIPDHYATPRYQYFHVTLQREVFKGSAVTVTYLGSRGRDLSWFRDINGPPLGTPLDADAIQQHRPYYAQFPQLAHIIEVTNDSRSWYDALQLSYRQNVRHGINTQYNYTLSSCEDYNSDNGVNRNDVPQANNPYNPAANKGPCGYDRRHNVNAAGTYAIPDSNALGTVSRGWEVATVFAAMSGPPFTPNLGTSFDHSGQDTGAIRANCLAAPSYNYDSNIAATTGIVTNAAQAYGTPPDGTLGTCGRNSARLPGFLQWDLSFLKTFRMSGDRRVQFRWEIFNLTNRANLGGLVSSNVLSHAFGTIGSTPDVQAGNPVIAQGGPRAMQWAVKVLF
jgi:hypothetical protein